MVLFVSKKIMVTYFGRSFLYFNFFIKIQKKRFSSKFRVTRKLYIVQPTIVTFMTLLQLSFVQARVKGNGCLTIWVTMLPSVADQLCLELFLTVPSRTGQVYILVEWQMCHAEIRRFSEVKVEVASFLKFR